MKTKPYEQLAPNWIGPDPMYDYLFSMPMGKYNDQVVLNERDKNGSKILCKEPYAQELYDKMFNNGVSSVKPKDLTKNTLYDVVAKSYNKSDKLVKCIEKDGDTEIYVPMSEIRGNLRDNLKEGTSFKVMVTQTKDGFNYASRKKCEKIINLQTLNNYLQDGTDFDVTVTKLIRGGFIALFDNSIECFLPGAHAAANIIYDFESYLGKTIRVCVDNYDSLSDMYIVSHKKYIKKILPERVQDIEYGKQYTGILTSDPTKFGVFVEFTIKPEYGSIFTGLIKAGGVPQNVKLKQGDEIQFYVSNVISNDRGVKINLAYSLEDVPQENLMWQQRKVDMEGKIWDYKYTEDSLTVLDSEGNDALTIAIDGAALKKALESYKKVRVTLVNVVTKELGLEFA